MKKCILLLLLLNLSTSFAVPLSGGVEYNVEDARLELSNNRTSGIDYLLIQDRLTDFYNKENQKMLLQGELKLKDRTLAKFSDGSYGVIYNNDLKHVWYYNPDGSLLYAEEKISLNYPYRAYKYTPDGELVNMSLRVSENETFIFDNFGNLIGHWVGSKCYDDLGKVIMTRYINK